VVAWGDIFGEGTSAQQFLLWAVGQQVAAQILDPVLQALRNELWEAAAAQDTAALGVPLSPADLAVAVNRHFVTEDQALPDVERAGTTPSRFTILQDLAGNSLSPQELAVALRRQLITEAGTGPDATSFEQGISESNLKNKWGPVVQELATVWPTPFDALQALLEGQVTEAEGLALYTQFGGDPQFFQMLFNTRGSAPSPVQAGEMANRGIIPWDGTGPDVTSFAQAFLEGPWRNKWEPAMRALATYVPPPRTVTALLHEGVITNAQAAQYFEDAGLTPELADVYVASATHAKTAAAKNLNESAVLELYTDKLIPEAEAVTLLEQLGYDANEAGLIVSTAVFRATAAALRSNVTRVGSYYIGRKIDRATASTLLSNLGVDPGQIVTLLDGWDVERAGNVKILTAAQIESAVEYDIYTVDQALTELEGLGYTPFDAWTLLSIKTKGALPNRPAQGPPPVQ
jgi:hypothetical protein